MVSTLTRVVGPVTDEDQESKLMTQTWARKLFSLSQILLQPDVRTMIGFQDLLRDQWLNLLTSNEGQERGKGGDEGEETETEKTRQSKEGGDATIPAKIDEHAKDPPTAPLVS